MNATHDDRLEELLNDLTDATLSNEDEGRLAELLRTDASARRRYRHFMTLHADLHWDYAAAVVSLPEANVEARREKPGGPWRAGRLWTAAVAVLLVVAGGLILTWRWRGDPDSEYPLIGRLRRLAGDVQIVARDGVHAIGQESELRAEATIHVLGLTGLATLRLDDGTEISLAGETRIACRREAGQTKITLHEGHLSANVAPQAAGHPLLIRTSSAEMQVLGTRLAVSADHETSELGVQHGRVHLTRLTDGQTVQVVGGQCAVVSQRAALEARPWPQTPDTWQEDFETGLPAGWRYGQWLRDGGTADSLGVVRAARRFALDGSDSRLYRITLPKRWLLGLWRLEPDTQLHFTYKMSRPGWFHIMLGVRSDDLNPTHIGNYELQSGYWKMGQPNEWQTVSVPFSAFRQTIPGIPYAALPPTSPLAGDVVYLMWFNTGDVDRGLVIDRIWVDQRNKFSEESP